MDGGSFCHAIAVRAGRIWGTDERGGLRGGRSRGRMVSGYFRERFTRRTWCCDVVGSDHDYLGVAKVGTAMSFLSV